MVDPNCPAAVITRERSQVERGLVVSGPGIGSRITVIPSDVADHQAEEGYYPTLPKYPIIATDTAVEPMAGVRTEERRSLMAPNCAQLPPG